MPITKTSATTSKIEPAKSKQKSKVVLDNDNEPVIAKVTEIVGNKQLEYEAEIKEDENTETDDETENQNTLDDDENFLHLSDRTFEEIPKDKLDLMFDDLEDYFNASNSDTFFAKITRIPDAMTDNFYIPCRDEYALGVFQFSLLDRFDFIKHIQKANNLSGCRVNVIVFNHNRQVLQIPLNPYSQRRDKEMIPIGIRNLFVPNPVKELEDTNKNGNSDLSNALIKIAEMQNNNTNLIIEGQNRILQELSKKEKSTLETAIEQKIINDIVNPKETSNTMEQTLAAMFTMPIMVEKMSEKWFPAPAPPKEPSVVDTIKEIGEMPIVKDASNLVLNLIEAKAMANVPNVNLPDTENEGTENPNQLNSPSKDDMQEMFDEIVTELETDNVINENNPLFVKLKTEYAEKFPMLVNTCQMLDFEATFKLLINLVVKPNYNPFLPFLDVEETNKGNGWIFNERGLKLLPRLQELHAYLKEYQLN